MKLIEVSVLLQSFPLSNFVSTPFLVTRKKKVLLQFLHFNIFFQSSSLRCKLQYLQRLTSQKICSSLHKRVLQQLHTLTPFLLRHSNRVYVCTRQKQLMQKPMLNGLNAAPKCTSASQSQ
jgi:hypothetical protein